MAGRGTTAAAMLLLMASAAAGQPDDRPTVRIPEPTRETRGDESGPGIMVTQVVYDGAERNFDSFPDALTQLLSYARSKSVVKGPVFLNERRLSHARLGDADLLYMTGARSTMQFSEAERNGLGQYLRAGGVLFADDIRWSSGTEGLAGSGAGVHGTTFDLQFKALIRDPQVLDRDGVSWVPLPNNHPLYRTYFQFPAGAPLGGAPGGNVTQLEGLFLRGRMVVVFSDLNLSWYWGDPLADARERGLQFGCNLLVYAMTQRALTY